MLARLDLDDLGAHVGEQHRGERGGEGDRQVQDAKAGQRPERRHVGGSHFSPRAERQAPREAPATRRTRREAEAERTTSPPNSAITR